MIFLKQRRPISAKIPGQLGRWGHADGKPHGIGCLILDGAQHMGSFREGRADGDGLCLSSHGTVPCFVEEWVVRVGPMWPTSMNVKSLRIPSI